MTLEYTRPKPGKSTLRPVESIAEGISLVERHCAVAQRKEDPAQRALWRAHLTNPRRRTGDRAPKRRPESKSGRSDGPSETWGSPPHRRLAITLHESLCRSDEAADVQVRGAVCVTSGRQVSRTHKSDLLPASLGHGPPPGRRATSLPITDDSEEPECSSLVRNQRLRHSSRGAAKEDEPVAE